MDRKYEYIDEELENLIRENKDSYEEDIEDKLSRMNKKIDSIRNKKYTEEDAIRYIQELSIRGLIKEKVSIEKIIEELNDPTNKVNIFKKSSSEMKYITYETVADDFCNLERRNNMILNMLGIEEINQGENNNV